MVSKSKFPQINLTLMKGTYFYQSDLTNIDFRH